MKSTYITEETIESLLPELSKQICTVKDLIDDSGVPVYLLSVGGIHYRIRRNDVNELIRKKLLPANIKQPIREYALTHALRRSRW